MDRIPGNFLGLSSVIRFFRVPPLDISSEVVSGILPDVSFRIPYRVVSELPAGFFFS